MAEQRIKVVLAGNDVALMEVYSALISGEEDMELLGVVKANKDVAAVAEKTRPDVILIDMELDNEASAIGAIEYMAGYQPNVNIVVLTACDSRESIVSTLKAGAYSYVLKPSPDSEILLSIRKAYSHSPYLSDTVTKTLIAEFRGIERQRESLLFTMNILSNLTRTEMAILLLLHEGKTQREICQLRCIETSTIKTHVQNILRKFGKSRIKAVISDIECQNLFPYLSGFLNH